MHVIDPTKSLYHIWEEGLFSHRCKLRPFCALFLKAAMADFEVHFNTAATRLYGQRVIEVLKAELLNHLGSQSEECTEQEKAALLK